MHALVNSAGVAGHKLCEDALWETSEREYDFVMDVNVRGLFHLLSAGLAPVYLETDAGVVHIGSMFSEQGFENGAVYATSKHAVIGMMHSAAKETNARVRVNCVLP